MEEDPRPSRERRLPPRSPEMFVEPEGCGQPGYCNPDSHFSYRQSPPGTQASPTSPSAHACRTCNRRVKPQKMTARVALSWTALPDDLISRLRMLRAWYLRYEEVSDLLFVDVPANTGNVKA